MVSAVSELGWVSASRESDGGREGVPTAVARRVASGESCGICSTVLGFRAGSAAVAGCSLRGRSVPAGSMAERTGGSFVPLELAGGGSASDRGLVPSKAAAVDPVGGGTRSELRCPHLSSCRADGHQKWQEAPFPIPIW